jgi:hypothetical protein
MHTHVSAEMYSCIYMGMRMCACTFALKIIEPFRCIVLFLPRKLFDNLALFKEVLAPKAVSGLVWRYFTVKCKHALISIFATAAVRQEVRAVKTCMPEWMRPCICVYVSVHTSLYAPCSAAPVYVPSTVYFACMDIFIHPLLFTYFFMFAGSFLLLMHMLRDGSAVGCVRVGVAQLCAYDHVRV